jgi:hypothetical protein
VAAPPDAGTPSARHEAGTPSAITQSNRSDETFVKILTETEKEVCVLATKNPGFDNSVQASGN